MKALIDQSDLVAGRDYISLSRSLVLNKQTLIDKITGAHHQLNINAARMIDLLEWPIPAELWLSSAEKLKIKPTDMQQVLFFLNDIGGLEIRRDLRGNSKIFAKRFNKLRRGVLPSQRSRRLEPTFINIFKAVIIAAQPLAITMLGISILVYGINVRLSLIILASTGFLALILVSTAIHEWVHSYVIGRHKCSQILIQRGLRIGIQHRRMPRTAELQSALLGPIIGAAVSILFGAIGGWALRRSVFFMLLGTLVAVMQLISLLPAYGDGRVAWSILRRPRNDS